MAKSKKVNRNQQNINNIQSQLPPIQKENDEDILSAIKIKKLDIQFKTKAQENMWDLIENKEIMLCSGPAGTGKSHIAVLKALDLIKRFPGKYKKIIIAKPTIESAPSIGYLPGNLDEKLSPSIYSLIYIFKKILGEQKVERMVERKQIEIMALGYFRGINLDSCVFILDESQNCDKKLIRTVLTRIGDDCKFIIIGDTTQVDIPIKIEQTGLYIAMKKLEDIPQIGIFRFADSDIVRNPIISIILERLNGEFQ